MPEPPTKGLTPAKWGALLARLAKDLAAAGKAADEQAVGEAYELLRRKLCDYFRRRPGLSERRIDTEALADETLDRLANNLLKGVNVPTLGAYAHGIARLVWLEQCHKPVQDQSDVVTGTTVSVLAKLLQAEVGEGLLACLKTLEADEAAMLVRYYHTFEDEQRLYEVREALAQEYQLTPTTLRSRIHRCKTKMLVCLQKRLAGDKTNQQ